MSSPKADVTKLCALKLESTPGTLISVAAADAKHIMFNPQIVPDDNENERPAQGGPGSSSSGVGSPTGKGTFEVELVGGATVPDTLNAVLNIGGYLDAGTGVFSRTALEKCHTFALYEDGAKRSLTGFCANLKLQKNSGKPARWMVDGIGKYLESADTAILSPTYPTVQPVVDDVTVTWNSYTAIFSQFTLDFGNTVILRPDQNATDNSGLRSAWIANHKPTFSFDPEQEGLSTIDWSALRLASTAAALSIAIGTTGNSVVIAAAAAQVVKASRGNRDGIMTREVTLRLNAPSGATPMTITVT